MAGSVAGVTSRSSTSVDYRGSGPNWTPIRGTTSIGLASGLHRLRIIDPIRYRPQAERRLPFSRVTDSMGLRWPSTA